MAEAIGLLAGVRVVDLSTFSPVRFGTTILADLGADVIQVDRPRSAFREDIRLLTSNEHPRWLWHSRNKRSLGLDLRRPGAKDLLLRLVADSDIVVEGFAPGVAGRLGLDQPSLAAVNPDLIYASVTGFGQTGPNAPLLGHEMNYQAMGGVTAAMAAAHDGQTAILPFPLGDSVASLYAVIAMLAALRRRDATGLGAVLDISIQDSVVSMLGYPAQYLWRDGIDDPLDIDEFGGSPTSSPYATADGQAVVLGAVEPWLWEAFCQYVERPDLVEIPADRGGREVLRTELATIFSSRTRDEWIAVSSEHGLALTAVLTLPELVTDPHVLHRAMVGEVEHPDLGPVPQIGTPIHVDGAPLPMNTFAVPGSDTAALLAELGVSESEEAFVRGSGAVFDPEPPTGAQR
ncbi:CoA transferase [Nocardioides endophyticus]|uniref:CoA transferase n=1 Tax=Nocardioides endophyticus TaxID=1353775 RepID=A0ABP8YFX4_9ACTN